MALPLTLPIWLLVTQLTQAAERPSALDDPKLFIAYGVDRTCCRGESCVGGPGLPFGLTLISRNRLEPLKAPAPKSRVTVKIPSTTATLWRLCGEPIWVPFVGASQSVRVKSYKAFIGAPLSV